MLTLKGIRTSAIFHCIGLTSMFCIDGQALATSIRPDDNFLPNLRNNTVESELSKEEIAQINNIRNDFNQQLLASKKRLVRVKEVFHRNLKVETDETTIRQTFVPVANAMEDIVVQQIMMIQQVNKVISAHMAATSPMPQDLTQGVLKETHDLTANTKQ